MAANIESYKAGSHTISGDIIPKCKITLITGITGQDGSYLTKFLFNKGYEVHGLIRHSSNFNTQRINHIYIDPHNAHKARMKFHYADLSDSSFLRAGSTPYDSTRFTILWHNLTLPSLLKSSITLLTSWSSEPSACWKPLDPTLSPRVGATSSTTKLDHSKCMDPLLPHNLKLPHFTLDPHTQLPNMWRIGTP
ncbi:hypothetical protein Gogos_021131 [Gossypium gossypioides]|uniref:GDP-mannose 4,6-dehydratase n=1 Tax=Gossypium gossypioides TaxID=34282 RepID=A0A7J9D7L0_GOSGO|nr:hypothetical protein [Gossypium gossypioides]